MTDEQLDRMIREADPYGSELMDRLAGADQALLNEIVSSGRKARKARKARWAGVARRIAGPVATAAAVTAVLCVVAVESQSDAPSAAPSSPAGTATAPVLSPELALKAAEDNPRLLIEEPGWKATTVYGFAEKNGTIGFTNGDRELEFDWYPADQYDSYYRDRLGVSAPESATVDGMAGSRFTYSANDFAIMLKPRNGLFVEMRTGITGWTRAGFDQLLPHIKQVDARTFLAAMPPEIVTPDRAAAAADKVLADIPLPPGFDKSSLQALGANDPYQFGAEVTKKVGCGWIAAWKQARQTGDQAGVKRAQDAMKSSHHWTVLKQMESEGAWSQSFWMIADGLAAGHLVSGSEESLECN
jgi:hypothetical protein